MNESLDLRQYLALALKWWWLVVLAVLIGTVAAFWANQRQPRVYRATTAVIVGQSIQATELTSNDILTSQRLAQTYADIARRQPVLHSVVDRLSLADTWSGLKGRVTVTSVRDTQLLEISVEAGSPEEARVTADELAHQLILLSPTALQNQEQDENKRFARQRVEDLQRKISAGQAQLATLEAGMSGSLAAEQVQEIQAEINDLEKLINEWENNYTQLLIFVEGDKSPNYLAVVEPAQANPQPIRPQVLTNTLLGGVMGLLLALGFIVLFEYLDDTLKSTADLSQAASLAALGGVGYIDGKTYADKLIISKDPFSPAAEAYRIVRSNIQFMSVDRPLKTILVTSPTTQEGKSVTAANLGVIMAQAGLTTILVDADLRRPVQQEIFQVPANTMPMSGLTELLCSPETKAGSYLIKTAIANLQLLTSGALPPNPVELLGSQRMGQVLAQLSELADVVIVDSPPVVMVADAAVLSARLDGVVLVAKAGHTRLAALREATLNLQQADAHLLGGILNQLSPRKNYGNYYYRSPYTSRAKTRPSAQSGSQRRWQWLPSLNTSILRKKV
ncbi:MAG: polysaccharide biosynthesis tyrosine autokinase [Chloroflexota bacterium]